MGAVTPTRVIGGRYVVLAELGRGGMGIVWRAEDRMMGRQVAVKELHLPEGLGPDDRRLFRERLLREARTAGRLNDPAIVTVYDVVSDGGVDHIVMELIEAPTLADVVARSGPAVGERPRWRWRGGCSARCAPPTSAAWCTATSSRPT